MNFFNSENGPVGPLIGFFGQVVDEINWLDNTATKDFKHKLHTSKNVAGFGYRYKVRIFGRDTQIKNFPDDQLEMAEVLLPTTAGSGHGGSTQTPNIKQGMYVFGFYKDGIDATEPIIIGVLPNNARTSLFGGDPDKNFVPRSGYFGRKRPIPVATKNIKIEGPTSLALGEETNSNAARVLDSDKNIDGTRKFYVPKTINCEGSSGELEGLQKVIKQLLIDIKRARRATQAFLGAASDLASNITNLINTAAVFVSSILKALITKIRGIVVNWFNKLVTDFYDKLPPNLRPNLAEGVKRGADTIECVFNKIISKLLEIARQLLLQIIDKYVNAPLCAIESFVGSFFATIIGELISGIQGAISAILGPVGEIASIIFLAMDILIGILNFLSCEELLDCQVIDEWSFFTGSNLTLEKLTGETGKKIQSFINNANNSAPPCSVSQIPCGPPKISFFGSGEGAAGNAVISATGYILGVDLLTGGRYNAPPDVKVIDDCGSGSGAVMIPITEEKEDGKLEVIKVVIVDPGFGYLTGPDGSTGGDGYTFSNPSDTIIFPPGTEIGIGIGIGTIGPGIGTTGPGIGTTGPGIGTPGPGIGTPGPGIGTPGPGIGTPGPGIGTPGPGINVFPPNVTIPVFSGQTGFFPAGSTVEVVSPNGTVVQTIGGQGQITPIQITENGFITTPDNETETFEQNADSYPILIFIEDLAILNEGVNYQEGDQIIISPDNGTVVEPILDEFGKIIEVNVISKGCGFTDIPEITVQSETGMNAVLVPIFEFQRIDNLDEISIPDLDTKVINVVDCIGKFKFKK
jgi:hypothetical protein